MSDVISNKKRIGRKTNEIGKIYGRLTVVSAVESIGNHAAWNCLCQCGKETIVTGTHLRTGHTVSCGCFHRESIAIHGVHGSKEYNAWNSMIARCYNEKSENYKNYGARGISVCDRWRESPVNFIADMGVCDKEKSLERIDVNGDYEPSNCKWATYTEQSRNKRNNNVIEFMGKKLCISEWAEVVGINRSTLKNRLTVRGWSVEKCLTYPVRFKTQNNGI